LRVVLVDSSEVFRIGLKALLADARGLVVAEAADASSALAAVRAHAPDLVITDFDLPDATGVALASSVREASPTTRVLLLAAGASEVGVRQAAVAGAIGYVLKGQPAAAILAAVRDAAAGREIVAPPTYQPSVGSGGGSVGDDGEVPRAARAAVLDRLSAREREIFDLIIWGQTNKQVAVKLGISVKTVETHRSHINGKLQVHSAAELVRLASLCGVLNAAGDTGEDGAIATARPGRDKPPGKVAALRAPLSTLVAKIG
jgi:DNA-binding NarL/FixJ family response regulator